MGLEMVGFMLNIFFVFECAFKIVAFGFVLGSNTYLKDVWNIIDFVIVVSSVFGNKLKQLRMIRVLRPLRAIKRIPKLKTQTEALIKSMHGVFNVIIFQAIMIYIFAVIGLELFCGDVYYACRVTEAPLPNATVWEAAIINDYVKLCDPENNHCPEEYFCGSPYQFNLTKESDEV